MTVRSNGNIARPGEPLTGEPLIGYNSFPESLHSLGVLHG